MDELGEDPVLNRNQFTGGTLWFEFPRTGSNPIPTLCGSGWHTPRTSDSLPRSSGIPSLLRVISVLILLWSVCPWSPFNSFSNVQSSKFQSQPLSWTSLRDYWAFSLRFRRTNKDPSFPRSHLVTSDRREMERIATLLGKSSGRTSTPNPLGVYTQDGVWEGVY